MYTTSSTRRAGSRARNERSRPRHTSDVVFSAHSCRFSRDSSAGSATPRRRWVETRELGRSGVHAVFRQQRRFRRLWTKPTQPISCSPALACAGSEALVIAACVA